MGVIEMISPSFSIVSVGLLNQLLYFLGKSGKVETMMKVVQHFGDRFTCSMPEKMARF